MPGRTGESSQLLPTTALEVPHAVLEIGQPAWRLTHRAGRPVPRFRWTPSCRQPLGGSRISQGHESIQDYGTAT